MSGYIGNTMTIERAAAFARSGETTEIADWVILLDLGSESLALYLRMANIAAYEDRNGVRLTLAREEADRLSKGDGVAALRELLRFGAITKVADYGNNKARFQIEIYPPEVRAQRDQYHHEGGLPVVSFG